MPKNVVSTKITIPKEYRPYEREAIARDIIEYLVKRTKEGKGKDYNPWPGEKANEYSPSYKKTTAFKIKRSKNVVNLELSGDMLSSVDLLNMKKGLLTIGIAPSDSEWGRAKGNILGSYGQPKPNKSKQRPFLDLSKDEIEKILKRYPLDDDQLRAQNVLDNSIADDLAQSIIDNLTELSEG